MVYITSCLVSCLILNVVAVNNRAKQMVMLFRIRPLFVINMFLVNQSSHRHPVWRLSLFIFSLFLGVDFLYKLNISFSI